MRDFAPLHERILNSRLLLDEDEAEPPPSAAAAAMTAPQPSPVALLPSVVPARAKGIRGKGRPAATPDRYHRQEAHPDPQPGEGCILAEAAHQRPTPARGTARGPRVKAGGSTDPIPSPAAPDPAGDSDSIRSLFGPAPVINPPAHRCGNNSSSGGSALFPNSGSGTGPQFGAQASDTSLIVDPPMASARNGLSGKKWPNGEAEAPGGSKCDQDEKVGPGHIVRYMPLIMAAAPAPAAVSRNQGSTALQTVQNFKVFRKRSITASPPPSTLPMALISVSNAVTHEQQ